MCDIFLGKAQKQWEKLETICEALARHAENVPDKQVWTFYNDKLAEEDRLTFQELEYATTALADAMVKKGMKTGDRALLVFVPGLHFTATLIACFKAGVVAVPVYPPNLQEQGKDMRHFCSIQEQCQAKFVLTHSKYSNYKMASSFTGMFSFGKSKVSWPQMDWFVVDDILSKGKNKPAPTCTYPNAPDGLAFLQFTSGSTSAPKGVMVSHSNLAHNIQWAASEASFDVDTVCVSWLPQYHDMGLIGTYLLAVRTGCVGHYMSPVTFLRDPLSWWRLVASVRCTYTVAPNFAYLLVLRKMQEATPAIVKAFKKLDFSSVKVMCNAAEPIDQKAMRKFMTVFGESGLDEKCLTGCWGLAEGTLTVSTMGSSAIQVDKAALETGRVVVLSAHSQLDHIVQLEGAQLLNSCGRMNHRIETQVAVVDPDTLQHAPLDRIGELWIYSSSKAQGYWGRPDASEETFGAKLKGSAVPAWLRTGDKGFLYRGELYFCGRIKDIVIINGLNYYPQDIEKSAEECHAAMRAGCSAAFAIKQAGDDTECCVYVAELKPEVKKEQYEEIVETILSAVSKQQGLYLSAVILVRAKSVPKTTSGKIGRSHCRTMFEKKELRVLHQWDDLEPETETKAAPKVAPKKLSLSEIRSKISAMVAEQVGEEVAGDATLLDTGLSSSATTEISMKLSKEFGVKVRPTVMFTSPTIDAIAVRVQELMEVRVQEVAEESEESDEEEEEWVRPDAHIAGWGIATPFPVSTEQFLAVDRRERLRKGQTQAQIDQMATFVKSSRIQNRFSCHPFFLPEGKTAADYPDAVGTVMEDIYTSHPDRNPPLYKRMQCYPATAVKMCAVAAERAVANWGKDKMQITHVLTTCTSGWSEPGIGCGVIKHLGLSEDVQKAELNFNGCFCGATCLRLANDLIRSGSAKNVLLVACEVGTTHFDWGRTETELMIAQSLFADGAASIVVSTEGVWKFGQTGSSIVPNSGHLLGLKPPLHENETCYVMTLSKHVSPALYSYFSKGHGRELLKKLYNPREARPALAIHPGGPRILEAVGDVFFELGWAEDALDGSYETFMNFGNLGSAAMLFVLAHRLGQDNIKEDKLVTMAFGPGVTVEYAQLERSSVAAKRAKKAQKAALASTKKAGAKSGPSSGVLMFMLLQTLAVLAVGAYCLVHSSAFAKK